MNGMERFRNASADKWEALGALADGVGAVRAAHDAPAYVHDALDGWLEKLEARYRAAADEYAAVSDEAF